MNTFSLLIKSEIWNAASINLVLDIFCFESLKSNMAGVTMSGGTLLSQLANFLGAPEPALRLLVSVLLGNVQLYLFHVELLIFTCRI
jgi:hypothetical protein